MMAKDVESSALTAIQRLFNSSVLLFVAWLLLLPGALNQVRMYNTALEITAWRSLVELAKALPVEGSGRYLKEGYVKNDPQTNFNGTPPPRRLDDKPLLGLNCHDIPGTDTDEPPSTACDPLVVHTTWPVYAETVIFLEPLDTTNIHNDKWSPDDRPSYIHFRVRSESQVLPFEMYLISRMLKDHFVVSSLRDDWTSLAVKRDEKLALYSRPLHWREALEYLGVNSLDEVSQDKLRSFQEKARLDQFGLNVSGLSLNAGYAIKLIGLVMAGLSFLMFGPIITLRAPSEAIISEWTLALANKKNPLLETACVVVTFLWAVMPVGIFLTLLITAGFTDLTWGFVNGAALLFSTIVFCKVALVLRVVRTKSLE